MVSGSDEWHSLIDLTIVSADLTTDATTLYGAGGNGKLDPGETVELSVRLLNSGGATAESVTGALTSLSSFVTVTDGSGNFGTIEVDGTGENTADRFTINTDPSTYGGHIASLLLITDFSDGAVDTSFVVLTVGGRFSTDPLGPDVHGYYAFDDTDTDYTEAPIYDWVEIDPGYGGDGTQVVLGDNGTYQDTSTVVDLPFTFNYYDQAYTRATICSNGWLAMGETYLVLYRNWTIPGAGGPAAMIAPFWDDLRESGGGHVYQKHDATNHRWIVQWSRMPNEYSRVQTVQAILFDPAHHPTSSGNGEIVFQYHTVENYDPSDAHATVGIESPDQSDGILYTFFGQYPSGAAPLAAGRAIRFLPIAAGPAGRLEGQVANASYGDTPIPGAKVTVVESDRTFTTGPEGTYGGFVQEGTYTVVAEHWGFEPDTANGVIITESETTILDFSLIDIAGPMLTTTPHGSTNDTLGPYPIPVLIEEHSGLAEASLLYRVNGGDYSTLALHPQGGNDYLAEIPGQGYGSLVEYYVYARDGIGNESFDPPNAPSQRFSFVVGPEVDILVDDFEQDHGWSVGAGDDNASSGIWVWADPVGTEYNGYQVQPEDDHTPTPGVICYATGNGGPGDPAGDNDVDGGKTTLFSPVFDLTGFTSARVSYWLWYTNDRGNNPGEDYWSVGVTDDGSNWISLENTTASTNDWVERSFQLDSFIELTDHVQLRYVARDDGAGSLVEAAIDDVVLTGIPTESYVYADRIRLSIGSVGNLVGAGAAISVRDQYDNPVGGAEIHSHWEGLTDDSDVFVTDANGKGSCKSDRLVRPEGCWYYTIDDVIKEGYVFRDDLSVTSDSICVPLMGMLGDPTKFSVSRGLSAGGKPTLGLNLPKAGHLKIGIYNVLGQRVRTLVDEALPAGFRLLSWDGRNQSGQAVSSGIYFYRIIAPDHRVTDRMILTR